MRWTIGRRLVLSMAVAVTVGMLGLTASLLMVHRQSELAQQEASNRLYTQLIATELAAGIHLKQPELVKRKLTVYERAFVGELAAVEAFAVDFSSLLQSGPSGAAAPPALKALLEREKERLAAGTAVGARVPDGIVAIAPAKLAGDTVVGYLAVQWSTAGLEARQTDSLKAAAIAFAVVLAVVMGLQGWLTARTVTRPIRGMAGVMQRLADGDHTLDVPGRGRSDEIGEIAATVEVFRQRTATIERLERERVEAAARAAEERRQLLARVAAEFEQSVSRMLSSIGAAVGITEEGAHKLRDAAESTKEQALQTQDHTVRTGDIVRTVEDVTQHLTRTIGEISDRVNDSGAMVKVAATRVRGSDAAVAALSQGSERIGEIIGLINSIAGQTNLLALNATIEAARAGEAGKGFTVVAHEVKALASQTAKATDDIANQVSSIRAATADVVDAMHAIRETIERLESLSAEMQSATGEQVSATREIVSAVAAAARTSTDTSDVVATMARSAAETGKAAVLMIGTARQLSQDVQELTGDTQRFLNSIRSA